MSTNSASTNIISISNASPSPAEVALGGAVPFQLLSEPRPVSRSSRGAKGPVRLLLPTRYAELEPPMPLSVINDDPLFNPRAAATILATSSETLKKWRQWRQGPDFIQYGEDGPIRYAWSALRRFIAQHTIKPETNR